MSIARQYSWPRQSGSVLLGPVIKSWLGCKNVPNSSVKPMFFPPGSACMSPAYLCHRLQKELHSLHAAAGAYLAKELPSGSCAPTSWLALLQLPSLRSCSAWAVWRNAAGRYKYNWWAAMYYNVKMTCAANRAYVNTVACHTCQWAVATNFAGVDAVHAQEVSLCKLNFFAQHKMRHLPGS